MVGPTHPRALEVYDFELVGRRLVDDKVVFDIDMRPKHKPEAAYVGRLSVIDRDSALIEAQLSPSRTILEAALPIPLFENFKWSHAQQWREFDGVWLAVVYRFEATIRIGMIGLHFPEIGVQGVTRLANYQVNVDVPDSLYVHESTVRVDTGSPRWEAHFGPTGLRKALARAPWAFASGNSRKFSAPPAIAPGSSVLLPR
jgi:hypothetical protein